jgi:hypothetical protein
MNTYEVRYRALNNHSMIDVIEAENDDAAVAIVKGCGMLLIIEAVREIPQHHAKPLGQTEGDDE